MRSGIEIYWTPESEIDPSKIELTVLDGDFEDSLSEKDKEKIEGEWADLTKKYPKLFFKPRSLLTLHNFKNGKAEFRTTDYKNYSSVSNTSQFGTLSKNAYENMRVGAVDCALETADGQVIVHKRTDEAPHVPNVYDASVGGLILNKKVEISLRENLLEKISRELKLTEDRLDVVKLNGFHSAREADYSALYTFYAKIKMERGELDKNARESFGNGDYIFVPKRILGDFIVNNYSDNNKITCLDGAMTLARSLPEEEFKEVMIQLKKNGRDIKIGYLSEGKFIETA